MTEEKCTCGKCKPKSKIPEMSKYFIGGLAGILLASFLAYTGGPKKAYFEDINKDGIQDIITETGAGRKTVYYGIQVGDKIEYRLPKDIEGWDYDQNPPFQ